MNTEKKDETGKAKCNDFSSAFKDCKEMFGGMNRCCLDQKDSMDCSAMMGMCCGRKTEDGESSTQ